eukprot:s2395_g7.t1
MLVDQGRDGCNALFDGCEQRRFCIGDAYAASLWGGSIGGIVVGILVIVLGAIGIVLGVLALIIPLFGALGSCVPFVDAACNDACTPCTDEEKKIWADACQTLGIIFVYLVVFGWAACVLGIVGASLACCVCCQTSDAGIAERHASNAPFERLVDRSHQLSCVRPVVQATYAELWTKEDAYAASLWGGSIGGIVVGILVIVLMSLPLCCGVLKQYGKAWQDFWG